MVAFGATLVARFRLARFPFVGVVWTKPPEEYIENKF